MKHAHDLNMRLGPELRRALYRLTRLWGLSPEQVVRRLIVEADGGGYVAPGSTIELERAR